MQKEHIRQKLTLLAKNKIIAETLKICNSIYFILFYALFTLLSSIFGLEIYLYLFTAFLILFVCLFAEDTKILFVPAFFIIFCAAFHHAPEAKPVVNYYLTLPFIISTIIAGCIGGAGIVFRLFVYPTRANVWKDKFPFKSGLLLIAVAFLCNGLFSREYTVKNLLYAFELIIALIAIFILFYQTIDWKKEYVNYLMHIFIVLVGVLILQFIFTLFLKERFGQFIGFAMKPGIVNWGIKKYDCYFGWGSANSFAGVLTMLLPAFYYFAYTKKYGYWFYTASFIVILAIVLSQGRASILISSLFALTAMVFFSIKKTPYRKFYWIFHALLIVCAGLIVIFLFDKIKVILEEIFHRGTSLSGRLGIWIGGLKNFWHYPIFGSGFYAPLDITDSSIIYDKATTGLTPYFYHNIFIEIIARFGLIGIVAFGIHFYELARQLVKTKNVQNTTFFCILLMILLCSLGDIFFFNLYFTFFYAIILLAWTKNSQYTTINTRIIEAEEKMIQV